MKLSTRRNSQYLFAALLVSWLGACGGSEDNPATGSSAGAAGASGASGASSGGSGGSDGSAGSNAGGTSAGGATGSGTGGATGSGTGGSSTGGAGGSGGCGTTQCTNCTDDDGDGQIDAADLQCTGAADDDEASYGTGIPGDNQDPFWQDCFFDGNSGAGDDKCRYHTGCLTGEKPVTDDDCIVSQACIDFCMPNVPNGCDCFGCCSVSLPGGGTKDVRLGPQCTPATINDTTACPTCTKSTNCNNDCGRCELCIGKTTLPADCNTGGTGGTGGAPDGGGGTGGACPTPTCRPGQAACGVSCLPACPAGTYCLTGCCVIPPPS